MRKRNIDVELTFDSLTYFTNGDQLIDGYMVHDAIERVIEQPHLRFNIEYESYKRNSRRIYEIMSIDFLDKGEYGFEDFIEDDSLIEKEDYVDSAVYEYQYIQKRKDGHITGYTMYSMTEDECSNNGIFEKDGWCKNEESKKERK